MMLPEIADPPRHYRMAMPQARPWITDNQRRHWRTKAGLVKKWRRAAELLAPYHLPLGLPGAHIVGELRFGDRRRRDPNNWNPTAKAVIDGMVDAGIFPDDHAGLIEGPDMRLGPTVPSGFLPYLIIHVWPKA